MTHRNCVIANAGKFWNAAESAQQYEIFQQQNNQFFIKTSDFSKVQLTTSPTNGKRKFHNRMRVIVFICEVGGHGFDNDL
ncbi:hypothetical protein ACTXT7_001057 [Hymenolepis weldensis]